MKTKSSKKANKVLTNFRFTPDVIALFRRECARRGCKQAWLVERAINFALAHPDFNR